MKKLISFLLICMLLTGFCSAFAENEAVFYSDLINCYDLVTGYSTFAFEDRATRLYTIYDENLNPVNTEHYIECYRDASASYDGVDLYRVAKEEGVNVFGYVGGDGLTYIPMEYAVVNYISPRWQYAEYVEKSDAASADYTTYDGNAYAISHYDFYYRGNKVLTLGRGEVDYTYGYGDYLIIRDKERVYTAYDKTGAVSYDGIIEYSNEFEENWREHVYYHIPTGQKAFTAGCTLTADEVVQDLMPIGAVYYDLQGNSFRTTNPYSTLNKFRGSYAVVESFGKYGVIDRNGDEVIPCLFDSSIRWSEMKLLERFGVIQAAVDGKFCYVNREGEITYQSPYDESIIKGSTSCVLRYIQDLTGEYILLTPVGQLDERFTEVSSLGDCPYCAVKALDGSYKVIDMLGNILIDGGTSVRSFYATRSGNLIFAYLGNSTYTMYQFQLDGQTLTPPKAEIIQEAEPDEETIHSEIPFEVEQQSVPAEEPSVETDQPSATLEEPDLNSWDCPSCGQHNTGNFCMNCGTPKPVPEDNHWICTKCETENEGNFCTNCGSPKPVPESDEEPEPEKEEMTISSILAGLSNKK